MQVRAIYGYEMNQRWQDREPDFRVRVNFWELISRWRQVQISLVK